MARRSYDKQFKIASIKLVMEDDMSVSDVSKIIYTLQYFNRWIGKYEEYGESVFPDHGTTIH